MSGGLSPDSSRALSKLYMELKDLTTATGKDIQFIKDKITEFSESMNKYDTRLTAVEKFMWMCGGGLAVVSLVVGSTLLYNVLFGGHNAKAETGLSDIEIQQIITALKK